MEHVRVFGFAKPRAPVQEHTVAASAIANVEEWLHVVGSCAVQFMIIFNPVTARRVYVERAHTQAHELSDVVCPARPVDDSVPTVSSLTT